MTDQEQKVIADRRAAVAHMREQLEELRFYFRCNHASERPKLQMPISDMTFGALPGRKIAAGMAHRILSNGFEATIEQLEAAIEVTEAGTEIIANGELNRSMP